MSQIVVPDETLLRAPELWVPGRKPVGPVRVDWGHPLARGLKHFFAALPFYEAEPPTDVVGNALTYTYNNALGVKRETIGGRVVASCDHDAVFGSSVEISEPTSITSSDDVSVLCSAYINIFTVDLEIVSFDGGSWSWLDQSGGVLRVSAYTAYDTTNTISTVGFHNFGLIWRTDSSYQTVINGRFSQAGTASRRSFTDKVYFGGGKAGLYYNQSTNGKYSLEWRAIWNRSLTEAECNSMYRDPYQFLIPA